MRDRTLVEIASLTDSMTALRLLRESSSDDDEHDPEGPTLSSEWSRIRGLLHEAEVQLGETDAALARVRAGTYGLCQNCGRAIPPARLQARPAARLCVPCAEAALH